MPLGVVVWLDKKELAFPEDAVSEALHAAFMRGLDFGFDSGRDVATHALLKELAK